MRYKVRYSYANGSYMSLFETYSDAAGFAMNMTENGEGYVKGIYEENGKIVSNLDDIWDFVWKRQEIRKEQHEIFEVRGDEGGLRDTFRG